MYVITYLGGRIIPQLINPSIPKPCCGRMVGKGQHLSHVIIAGLLNPRKLKVTNREKICEEN